MSYDKIIDAFMFREGTIEDNETTKPLVTTGSIVWGVILRSAIIMIISLFFVNNFRGSELWYIMLFAVWFFAAYPGYKQYKQFNSRMKIFQESTLCGTCKFFEPSGQLCIMYDEHVSSNHIPCDGQNWEPKK